MRRPDRIDGYVGGRLRLRRRMLNLTQENLGKRVGVTFQQVQKYERGTNRICVGRLYKLACVLEVPVSYFFPKLDASQAGAKLSDDAAPDHVLDFVASSEGLELNRAFARIRDPKVRRRVSALVRSIAAGPVG